MIMPVSNQLILCPACSWKPDGGAYWRCSCGNVWDTFSTYGKCPECSKVHLNTECIACQKTSPHHDWYVEPIDLPETVVKESTKV